MNFLSKTELLNSSLAIKNIFMIEEFELVIRLELCIVWFFFLCELFALQISEITAFIQIMSTQFI